MKRRISLFIVAFLVLSTMCLSACQKAKNVDRSTIYVKKNGKVIGISVEKFDKEYYDATELEKYVEDNVKEYLSNHNGKSVKVDKFSVKNGVANLRMQYAGYKDYAEFNEVELFSGTVIQAMAAGYDFNESFVEVKKGKLGGSADKNDVTEDSKYKVIILSEKVDVIVDGTILFVSSDYTSITAKDTVSINLPADALDGEELSLTYIIYK